MAPDINEKKEKNGDPREYLSLIVTVSSIAGVFGIALIVIYIGRTDKAVAQMVLTATLPLFGAWVGTILAFYFGKENFEAATRSVTAIARTFSPEEKLKSIPARDKMIPRDKMLIGKLPAGQIKLLEILDKLTKEKKGDRYPVLNDKDHPVYIIHRSAIDKYLVDQARQAIPSKLEDLTLQNLLDGDPEMKNMFETSFAIVRESATLADAKIAMERTPKCLDVFVTNGGTKVEPVTGWITNAIIQENAKV